MPTDLKRCQVAITPGLARAIATGRAQWPQQPTSQVITRLAQLGADVVQQRQQIVSGQHVQAVDALVGAFPGAFGPGYLDDLRGEWD